MKGSLGATCLACSCPILSKATDLICASNNKYASVARLQDAQKHSRFCLHVLWVYVCVYMQSALWRCSNLLAFSGMNRMELGLQDAQDAHSCFIDASVYSRNRAFRLFLSSKAGKHAVLLPTGKFHLCLAQALTGRQRRNLPN